MIETTFFQIVALNFDADLSYHNALMSYSLKIIVVNLCFFTLFTHGFNI